jgi:hypothetical protein
VLRKQLGEASSDGVRRKTGVLSQAQTLATWSEIPPTPGGIEKEPWTTFADLPTRLSLMQSQVSKEASDLLQAGIAVGSHPLNELGNHPFNGLGVTRSSLLNATSLCDGRERFWHVPIKLTHA